MNIFLFVKNKKGLTLVDTVIAMIIAAIILIGFLQICNSSMLALKNVKYRLQAMNIARAEMEAVMSDGYEPNANDDNTVSIIIDEGQSASPDDDVLGEMRTIVQEVSSSPNRGNKIVIEITWAMRGQPRSEILETVVYNNQ